MSDRLRARTGVALLIAAALCFCLRLAIASHDRAWDADAAPRASYDLVINTQYRLSTVDGPIEAVAQTALSCTIQAAGTEPGPVQPLTVQPLTGDRITHDVATFVAPFTGAARIDCSPGPAVFVDGAAGIGMDRSALLMVLGIALGVLGLLLASSAAPATRRETQPKRGPVPASAATGTTVDPAPGV